MAAAHGSYARCSSRNSGMEAMEWGEGVVRKRGVRGWVGRVGWMGWRVLVLQRIVRGHQARHPRREFPDRVVGGRPLESVEDAATRIQAWYRGSLTRRWYERNHLYPRFSLYQVAAFQIQHAFAQYAGWHTSGEVEESGGVRVAREVDEVGWAVFVLQRAFRGYAQKRVFAYFKDLLYRFRSRGSPIEMLRTINPSEAALMDAASKLRVLVRLGGASFPPQIYYKIVTEAPICDVGAFAPRDSYIVPKLEHEKRRETGKGEKGGGGEERVVEVVVGDRKVKAKTTHQGGWYQRVENNGWRPVIAQTIAEAQMDPVTKETAARAKPWHWSKLKRREHTRLRQKRKKIEWLRRLYKQGAVKAKPGAMEMEEEEVGEEFGSDEGKEGEMGRKWERGKGGELDMEEVMQAAAASVRQRLGVDDDTPVPFSLLARERRYRERKERRRRRRSGFGGDDDMVGVEESVRLEEEEDERIKEALRVGSVLGVGAEQVGETVWSSEVQRLLEWTHDLDFEAYTREWGDLGVSAPVSPPPSTTTHPSSSSSSSSSASPSLGPASSRHAPRSRPSTHPRAPGVLEAGRFPTHHHPPVPPSSPLTVPRLDTQRHRKMKDTTDIPLSGPWSGRGEEL